MGHARLFPDHGDWSESDYLSLKTDRLVELSDGRVEVLSVSTEAHLDAMLFFYELLYSFVQARQLAKLLVAPMPVRLWPEKMRMPDVLFMKAENSARRTNEYWDSADLVAEIFSIDRRRDLEVKRAEYARAGILEYWIWNPSSREITVLVLDNDIYRVGGQYRPGETAASVLIPGFTINVAAAFNVNGFPQRCRSGRRKISHRRVWQDRAHYGRKLDGENSL